MEETKKVSAVRTETKRVRCSGSLGKNIYGGGGCGPLYQMRLIR